MNRKTNNNSLWQSLRRHPLLYNMILVAVLLVLLALLSYLAMLFGTRHGVSRTVPDFKGLHIDDARYYASRRDLNIVINDSLYVPAYPGGVVLDQLPQSGVRVKPGRKVYVTINSFRQPQVEVPYVAGRSLRQAKNMLEAVGLTIESLEYVEDIATNYVLAELLNGEEIMADSAIKVERGSGIMLRVGVAPSAGEAGVPHLLGRTLFEAKSRLWESGLNVGEVTFDDGVSMLDQNRVRVYRQSVMSGAGAAYGTAVALAVTLDEARLAEAEAEYEKILKAQQEERMRADSIAAARAQDSLLRLQSKPAESEDNFFF